MSLPEKARRAPSDNGIIEARLPQTTIDWTGDEAHSTEFSFLDDIADSTPQFWGCRVTNSATQNAVSDGAGHGIVNPILYNTVRFDGGGRFHFDTTNTDRLYAPFDGYYFAHLNVLMNAGTVSWEIAIQRYRVSDSTDVMIAHEGGYNTSFYLQCSNIAFKMFKGDYVYSRMLRSGGAGTGVIKSNAKSPEFTMIYLGPL